MIEQSNRPLTKAIEMLVETLNTKLDAALEKQKTEKNKNTEHKNQFENIDEDIFEEDTDNKRMQKLKEHQSKLSRMSQNLATQLDQVHQNSPSIPMEENTPPTNTNGPDNLIRNLSITITSIEHKIKNNEDKHNQQILNLQNELHQLNLKFNSHLNSCQITGPAKINSCQDNWICKDKFN